MTLILESPPVVSPALATRAAIRLVAAAPSLWRVLDASGIVIGHLEEVHVAAGIRFRARRYHPPSRAFRDLGAFWSADDAVECLRYSR